MCEADAKAAGDRAYSDRYDAAVGSPPYGITFSEWALSNPASWAYLAPIVLENNGWALFITTARGRNHTKTMLDIGSDARGLVLGVLPVQCDRGHDRGRRRGSEAPTYGHLRQGGADALIDQEY